MYRLQKTDQKADNHQDGRCIKEIFRTRTWNLCITHTEKHKAEVWKRGMATFEVFPTFSLVYFDI